MGRDGPVGEVIGSNSGDVRLALEELDASLDPALGRTGRKCECRLAESEDKTSLVILFRPRELDAHASRLERIERTGVSHRRGLLGGS